MDTSKVIRGVVNSGRYTVTAPIVKEDYGLYLQIEGVELPSTYEVDFSNSEHSGTSVTMIGNSDGVLIPHQFIDTGKDIFAFLYHVGADFGRTVYKFRIPNKCRPDRTNEEPTPEEQSTIDQAISALNTAVAQTAQDVASADASAQSASADAERAEEARTDAQNYATQAEQSATDAQTSASHASASATASAQSASQSAQIKSDVEGMVDDAQASASASVHSASASANSASQASASATSASQSATSAQGYASQAQTSAQTASSKASEASGYASTASTKAGEASNSASTALGYKNDAENAKIAAQTAQGLAESARDSAVSAKADAESARDEAVQAVASISGALDDKADIITDTASGAVASFPDGADDLPLRSLLVNIDPVQDLHGYDSPWPAGGGKNLIYKTLKNVNINPNGAIAVYNPYDIFFAKVESGKTYTVSIDGVATRSVNAGYFAEDPVIGSITYDGNRILDLQATFEATYTGYIGLRFPTDTDNVQLEEGSTATSWSPYENLCPISGWTEVNVNHSDADMTNLTTLTIQLGQTVYGGKLDVLTGELVAYPYYASYNGETLTGKWISDRDKYVAGTTPTIGAQVVNIGAGGTEYQLTPQEVKSLLGTNNIFADTGDSAVEYRADTKLYIAKKIAEAISALS